MTFLERDKQRKECNLEKTIDLVPPWVEIGSWIELKSD